MKVDYIEISDSRFKTTFNYPISEIEFAIGGVFISDKENIGSAVLYKNPYFKAPNNNGLLFGYFKASNATVAKLMFEKIEEIARNNQSDKLIGPINGSTWYDYRLMDAHNNTTFLGEEITPLVYNDYLKENEFKVLKSYQSNLASSSDFSEELILQKETELKENEWKVRPINKENLNNELALIANFSNKAFASNFLYSPIKKNDFIEKYRPLMQQLPTDYIWLVENTKGELKTIMLAYENLLSNSKELILVNFSYLPYEYY